MIQQLQRLLENRVNQCIQDDVQGCPKIERKKQLLKNRQGEIVNVKAKGKIIEQIDDGDRSFIDYKVHFVYVIRQKENLFLEEEVEHRKATFFKQGLIEEKEVNPFSRQNIKEFNPYPRENFNEDINIDELLLLNRIDELRVPFQYDRRRAVQYAETWWNDYNPKYKKFDNDCTNYISQCFRAGGAPMRGYPNRSKGWWMQNNNWSYSWTVSNSLRLHLLSSKVGLRGVRVSDPKELQPGDVIFYDFQGDGRFDHSTIVVAKDANGEPLVNAHTYNSRMRYWAYEDSTAYTKNIKYTLIKIIDDNVIKK